MAGKFSIYKYCKTGADWRYRKAAFYPNGKIKPNVVLVKGESLLGGILRKNERET